MSDALDSLVLDLLEWLSAGSRPYPEIMRAWRTSCPRLPVWEEANDRGFIEQRLDPERGTIVSLTALGAEYLRVHRP